jgi:hypothetical protein
MVTGKSEIKKSEVKNYSSSFHKKFKDLEKSPIFGKVFYFFNDLTRLTLKKTIFSEFWA